MSWLLSLSTHTTPILHTTGTSSVLPFVLLSSPASFPSLPFLLPFLRVGPNTHDRRDSSSFKLSFLYTQTAKYTTIHFTLTRYFLYLLHTWSTVRTDNRTTTTYHIPHTGTHAHTQPPYSLRPSSKLNIPLTSPSFSYLLPLLIQHLLFSTFDFNINATYFVHL